ncbi:AAA family ATPase [Chloroflexota bacterium]
MAIITISRGSYSRGKVIAEKVAEKLGYTCIDRETIIEASEQYNIPEMKLVRAIRDAPSILERFGYGKEKYVAYFTASFLRQLKKDNVVYHGLAGHFLVEGIPHVLKVRIISDMEDRIELEMERESISRKEAQRILQSDDKQRRNWSKYLFGIDNADVSLYDLVLNIQNLTVDNAVSIICGIIELPDFRTTPESQKTLEDLLLACEVKVALIDVKRDIDVSSNAGTVLVKTRGHSSQKERLIEEMKRIGQGVPGVKEVHINVLPQFPEIDL